MLNAAVVYAAFMINHHCGFLNALARSKWTLIFSGTNQTSPTTNLRGNRHRPAFLTHPSWFAVGGIICLVPLLHAIYSWRGGLQIYVPCQPHEKYLLCIFTCNWTLWRIRAMRSSKLKEVIKMVPHINTLIIHECCQSWMQLQYQWGEGRLKGGAAGAHNSKYGPQSLGKWRLFLYALSYKFALFFHFCLWE